MRHLSKAVVTSSYRMGYTQKTNLDRLEQDPDKWLAVSHADGNGIGQIFQRFGRIAETLRWSEPGWKMLEFSLGLAQRHRRRQTTPVFQFDRRGKRDHITRPNSGRRLDPVPIAAECWPQR